MLKRFARYAKYFLFVLALVALLGGSMIGKDYFTGTGIFRDVPTVQEKQEELSRLLYGGVLGEVLKDEQPDRSLFEAGWLERDLSNQVLQYTRVARTEISFILSEEEAREALAEQSRQEEGGLSEEARKQINQFIEDNLREDGTVDLSGGEGLPVQITLLEDSALAHIAGLSVVANASREGREGAEKIQVKITIQANPAIEDSWKTEVLFDGSVKELMESDATLDFQTGVAVFQRPENKLLPQPAKLPYPTASISDLLEERQAKGEDGVPDLEQLVYVRNVGGAQEIALAHLSRLDRQRGIAHIQGDFSVQDLGSPVFWVQDGELYWVGMLAATGGQDMPGLGVVLTIERLENIIP